jgi:hypothetical protein
MEQTCKTCDRIFSTPYNLRQHYQRFHPLESQPKLLRMSREVYPQKGAGHGNDRRMNGVDMGQYGGRIRESNRMDDDSDDDSMINNVGSDSESDTESELESESESDVDSVDNEPNWVFDSIIEEAEEELGRNATYKDIRKLFRRKLADKIEWVHNFRKHPIYKKIMATAKDLQDGPGDYDKEEAVKMAIRQRRTLLDRLIPYPNDSIEDEGSGQGISDEGDDDSDDATQ